MEQRERVFTPSNEAVEKALAIGIRPGNAPGAWRALGDMYLDSFHVARAPRERTGPTLY